ncbi:hypothetical protein P280DRAFT_516692 [Massarina eburnea CBS 473.64]|uniref:Myb-like domain-containing protein n=1 Tax=Massarina eburnea CBS 473.64 TaxID=1395130 RepID=A0A6A6S3J5_9PLEO|nr:hypothetical protein P280DRAFT_516692 [Massarina eburnea CBS 473.64]
MARATDRNNIYNHNLNLFCPAMSAGIRFPIPLAQQLVGFTGQPMSHSGRPDSGADSGAFAMQPSVLSSNPQYRRARMVDTSLRHNTMHATRFMNGQVDNAMYTNAIAQDPECGFKLNNHLSYPGESKGTNEYRLRDDWPLSNRGHLPQEHSVSDTTSSTSPKSFLSDQFKHDEVSPASSWDQHTLPSPEDVKLSPGGSTSSGELLRIPSLQSAANMMINGHSGTSLSGMNTMGTSRTGLSTSSQPVPMYTSMYDRGASHHPAWPDTRYTHDTSRMQYYDDGVTAPRSYPQRNNGAGRQYGNSAQAPSSHRTLARADDTSSSTASQDYSSSTPPSNTVSRRKIEDKILVACKNKGMTYKQIKEKLKTSAAESTLRGRYRALTKDKDARVRKPVWMDKDLRLLEENVQQQLDSLDSSYQEMNEDQQLSKVSWKKVSEYIVEHGGSYAFGNSTCKKKWVQLQASRDE